jgi:hypothetical protein
MGHKSAWAEEEKAPTTKNESDRPRRRIVAGSSGGKPVNYPMDILIVASKLKDYVKQKHGMNTSANVMEQLSHIVRYAVDGAVDNARAEGRKTLMDRDFQNK